MLAPLPRLTCSLRAHFDADQAYLLRKAVLQARIPPRPHDEWELARRIVPNWDDAPSDVRQAYKQFIGAVVELLNGEVVSEEFQQVAQSVYRLFGGNVAQFGAAAKPLEKRNELESLVGYSVQESVLKKLAQFAQKLHSLQGVSIQEFVQEDKKDAAGDDTSEFGASFDFKAPSRFIIDVTLDDDLPFGSGAQAIGRPRSSIRHPSEICEALQSMFQI